MSWIETIPFEAAGGDLRAAYDAIVGRRGKLSNIMTVQSLNPAVIGPHMDLYMAVMFGRSGLRRDERELIGVVVSAANGCAYCVRHHAEALLAYWKDEERVRLAAENPDALDLDERMTAVLEFALDLTTRPQSVDSGHVARMRKAGLSDRDILDVDLVVAYFNFVNRIALGLGVAFSPDEVAGYRY